MRLAAWILVCAVWYFAPYHVAAANTEFITVWQTTADNESITIPTHSESIYNYTVDWGDSNTNVGQTGDATHSYAIAGTHRVSITGDFPRIYFNDAGDNEKIISIEQWGNIAWSSMENAFEGCANLRYDADDMPDLSSVTSTAGMFRNADFFNGDIGLWNVSAVTNMSGMFDSATSFNQNLNSWDVSQVTDMSEMFLFAAEFKGDISGWKVGQVTDMSGMFLDTTEFNGDISEWDVSQVTNMSEMFLFATEFNSDISGWKVGQVTDMSNMFESAESFNQNLNLWDVSAVTDMSSMFSGANEFNGDISGWEVGQVTGMSNMFFNATLFNGKISQWDVSKVTDMSNMFFDVTLSTETYDALLVGWSTIDDDESSLRSTVNFHAGNSQFCNTKAKGTLVNTPNGWIITDGGQADNCPRDTEAFITTWRTTTDNESITIPTHSGSIYNYNVDWGDSNISFRQTGDVTYSYAIAGTHRVSITGDFPRIYFNGTGDNEKIISIEQWGPIAWSSMENAFEGCVNLRYNAADRPNLSSVTSTAGMFRNADFFNGDIGLWDVSTVTNMAGMFDSATSFNQNLSSWDVSQVTDMSEMFLFAAEFNGDISGWKVGQVTDMSGMFLDATQFNGDISEWDVSQVTNMSEMFLFATEFNSDISRWKVGQVTDMSNMFESAESFNQNLSLWDVSAVTDMSSMFSGANEFNGDISGWEVGQVTGMSNMFFNATLFNGKISQWDVSKVTDMSNMFFDVTLSTETYDALLVGWSTIDDDESSLRSTVNFHAGSSRYCNQAARNILIGTYSWMITDGNRDTDGNCLIPELTKEIADQDIFANTEFGYTFSEDTFHSPRNDTLTYTVNKSPPAEWLNFNAETRSFSGIPSADDIGMITITVTATDSNGNSASGTFTITIPNRPPVAMAGLTSQRATVGNLFEYPIPDGTFSDPDGGRLSYTATGRPEWLNFSTRTRIFSGTPRSTDDIGVSTITVTATDQFNSSASGTFTITVPNRPPTVMAGFTPQMAMLDELFEYPIPDGTFSDPDGGPLSYTATGQPGWLNFSTRTRIFSGTPGSTNDIGVSTITVTVTDLNGGNLVSTFTVTVPNQPPIVAAGLVNQSAVINTAFSYSIDGTFSDPDRGTLSYTATGRPGWLNFSTISNTFSGTPTNTNDIGISTITVTVADHLGAISTDDFTLTVVQVNMPTTLTMALENRTAYAGELFMYDIEGFFSDPDGGPLSYTATGQPGWLNFSTRTRIFSGTPTSREDIGISTVTITATDQFNSSASGTFTITVPNRPPVVAAGLTSQTATVGNLFEYPIPDGAFSDPDGGPLSYQTEGQPGWLNFSTRTRIFSGTPGSTNDIGVSTITVTVTDLNGGILVSTFTVTVSNSFITIWRTTADNESITIPTHSESTYNYNVDWGDSDTSVGQTGDATHSYAVAGTHRVSITGDFPRIYFNDAGDKDKIISIEQWGNIAWSSMESAFAGCTNLRYNATDRPDLSRVTSTAGMFRNAVVFNGNIGLWDVSQVTDMAGMFNNASSFNQNLNLWDVSQVTDMAGMFSDATKFNGDISGWEVGQVTDMNNMFNNATSFNQGIGNWNVSQVADMEDMFVNVTLSTENYDALLSGWSTIDDDESNLRSTVNFNAGSSQYCNQAAKNILTNPPNNWIITDDGQDTDGNCLIPELANEIADQDIFAGIEFNYTFPEDAFHSPRNDTLTYTVNVSPSAEWLNFSSETRTFSGTPSTENIGMTITITVTATDANGNSAEDIFTLTTVLNQPPVVAAGLVNQSAVINTPFSYSIDGTFSDPDGGRLSYTETGRPEWLSFSTINNTFSGTPTSTNDIGISTVTVTATDQLNSSASGTFTITVPNRPPVTMAGLTSQRATVGNLFEYPIPDGTFSDPDGGRLSYTATGRPEWLSFSTINNTFSGTPTRTNDIGISTITVTVTDLNGGILVSTFTVTVLNQPPVVEAGLVNQRAVINTPFSYSIDGTFSDPDRGPLSYTATGRPEWLSFSTINNTFSGTPTSTNDIGISTVTVTATDQLNSSASGTFTITVANRPPVTMAGLTSQTATVGNLFEYPIPDGAFSDPDGGLLSYTATGRPRWLDFSTINNTFSGTPGNTDDVGISTITVTVTDLNDGSLVSTFTITVPNQPPIVAAGLVNQNAVINIPFSYSIDGTFSDPDRGTLSYTATGRPGWLDFSTINNTFSGTPTSTNDIGISTITVTVADHLGAISTDNFTLTVVQVNMPTTLTMALENHTAYVGELFMYDIEGFFSDPDGGPLSYTATGQPGWFSFSTINNTFSGTPTSTEDIGISTVTITATDQFNSSASGTFTITVPNRPPVTMAGLTSQRATVGNLFEYPIPDGTFSDPDGGRLSYTATGQPRWLDFLTIDNTFSGTPTSTDDIGISTITVTVTDLNGGSLISTFTVTVPNQPPIVEAGLVNQSAVINTPFSYSIDGTFSDPDGGSLSYTATGKPGWLNFSTETRIFSGTPTRTTDIGVSTITVTVADHLGAISTDNFTLTVVQVNMPTTLTMALENHTAYVGELFMYDIEGFFSDPDGGPLSYTVTGQPGWLDFSTINNTFSGTPTSTNDIGISTVTITATDQLNSSASGTFTITVPNRPPVVEAGLTSQRATVGNLFEYPIPDGTFSDPDGGRLSYTATGQPRWLDFSTINNTFSGTPDSTGDIGVSTITVTVTDPNGGSLISTFTVTVPNQPPVVEAGLVNQNAVINTPFSYSIDGTFSDPDRGPLSYTATGRPEWLNFSTINNTFSGTPTSTNDIGISTITVTVTDLNDGSLVSTFTVTVSNPFITIWRTIADNESITIPTHSESIYNYTVNWGDNDTSVGQTGDATHSYAIAGTHRVSITGDFPRIYFNGAGDNEKIISIEQWGNIAWSSMESAFAGCTNLGYNAADMPDLSSVTSTAEMFRSAVVFNGDIGLWDVSMVTDMSGMFFATNEFNGDISEWDVSQVNDMSSMFFAAISFNQNLNKWKVGQVTNMSGMFFAAISFNQNLNNWNVSSVTDMFRMFSSAAEFNGDISPWDVSQVAKMEEMFANVTLSTENYDALLSGWSTIDDDESSLRFSVNFDAGNSQYCNQAAKNILTGTYSWMITDGNRDTDGNCRIPELANEIANQDIFAGTEFSYTFPENTFHSPRGDTLTYTVNIPSSAGWLNFSSGTRTFFGNPSAADIGAVDIAVTATDSNGNSAEDTFTLTVLNQPPVVAAGLVNQSAVINTPFSYSIDGTFSDPDGGRLSYTATGRPGWLDFSTINNTFSGTPTSTNDIGISTVTVTATDQLNSSASGTFTITVLNRTPTVNMGLESAMLNLGQSFVYLIPTNAFSDADIEHGDTLTYTVIEAPERDWLSFDTDTFLGTPENVGDIGISTITVTATDENGASVSSSFTITVLNRTPTVNMGLESAMLNLGQSFVYLIPTNAFSDADIEHGDTLTYTVIEAPERDWLSFDTDTFLGTPENVGDIGISTITVTATDENGASVSSSFTITVLNRTPTVNMGLESAMLNLGQSFVYLIPTNAFSDADIEHGDTLTYTVIEAPERDWLSFDTDTFLGTPENVGDIGISTITVTATDENGASVSSSFTITVLNRTPTVNEGLASAMLNLGQSFEYRIPDTAFGDDDIEYDDTLTYTAEGHPREWLSFDIDTFSGMPASTEDHIGINTITVTATDENGASVSSSFTITVVNQAPTVNMGLESAMLNLGQSFVYLIPPDAFSDADIDYGDTLTYTVIEMPETGWLSFDTDTFLGTPENVGDIGISTITVTATDENGASVSSSFTITVVNQAPTVNMGLESAMLNLGQSFVYLIPPDAFSDADIEYGDTLTYTVIEAPERDWLSFDTDTFLGTPENVGDIGSNTITVTATDKNGASVSSTFTVTVTNPFITIWRTTADNESITIPTHNGSIYNYTVNWGDGSTSVGQTGDATHRYAVAGDYRVSITGDFPRIYFNGAGDNEKIISIEQWGNIAWSSMEDAFAGCINLRYNATDRPDLSSVTSTARMFRNADFFNGNIGLWDVSQVTDMSGMFDSAASFDQDLNLWNVSSVTDMSDMFSDAAEFNGDISEWDVDQVTDMSNMFDSATFFDQDLNLWNVSSVTDMSGMFLEAEEFNGDIRDWKVDQVTDMSNMFLFATEFNSDISGWKVGQVTDMSDMFDSAESFNQDLNLWDVSSVTDMSGMFFFAISFNQDLNNWKVGQVTDMSNMFYGTDEFNGNISQWNVGQVTDMSGMFFSAFSFNQNLNLWNVSSVTDMSSMFFGATEFNGDISQWDVSQVTDMEDMFFDVTLSTENYDALLSGWSTIDDDESSLRSSVRFDAGSSRYCNRVARNILTGTYSWMITDGSRDTAGNCRIPELANEIADQDIFVGTEFSYTFSEDTFNSPSNSSLIYTVNQSPPAAWLNFNAGTRTFSGTPPADDIGVITITVTATDANGNSAKDTFTLTTVLNQPPVVAAGLVNQSVVINTPFSYSIDGTFSDPDGGPLSYTAAGQPEWLNFSTINNTFSGTPTSTEDIGISTVTITATDQLNSSASGTFTITVLNQPPIVMAGFTPQIAMLGELFEYPIPDGVFSDPDGGRLSYTATGQPSWLNFSPDTRIFSGTPTSTDDIGVSTITVTVTDLNGGNLASTFTVTVTNPFITIWRTTADNESITIPTHSGSIYNYTVNWGDSNTSVGQTGDATHSYAVAGDYRVSITGDFPRIYFNGAGDNEKIISIEQWGNIAWSSMESAFEGCANLRYNAADMPDLSNVTSTAEMFRNADIFNGNIGLWDVSMVTDMSGMFDSAVSFNRDLNGWDVGQVTDMSGMFDTADSFDQDLPDWDVSKVTDMSGMFSDAAEFNGDISGWNVGQVTDMSNMFDAAAFFNQNLNWDVSQVTDMSGMFLEAVEFNGDISGWDVSQVTDMSNMFLFATEFNSDISGWNVGRVTDMSSMFDSAESFNQNLNNWNVSSVTDMSGMFLFAISFNQDLTDWDVSKVTDMSSMFFGADEFNGDINGWDVSQVAAMEDMFFDVTLSTENYDALLSGWSTIDDDESSLQSTVNFDAGSSRYCNQAARNILTGTYSWMITDDGQDTDRNCLIPELANEIADQDILAGTEFSYTFSEDTFNSPSNSSLTYTVNQSLPAAWLNFNADTRTFSGTPSADDIGVITITVTATDSNGNSAEDTFTLTVNNPALKIKMKIKVFLEGAQ